MKKLITALFILLFPLQTFAAFAYSLPITIQHGQVANTVVENYTKFPIDVDITQSTLKTIGNGGHVQNSNGYDIYFYSDSGCTTRLPAERELYNASTGRYTGWVQMAISTTSDKVIYTCYGDSGISTDPNLNGTYGATSVWDTNYKGVWHLPNGTSLTTNDSTSNGSNGTAAGTATAGAGKIDGGLYTYNNGDRINITDNSSFTTVSTGDWTEQIWINLTAPISPYYPTYVQMGIGGNYIGQENGHYTIWGGDVMKGKYDVPTAGSWQYIVGTKSGTTYTMYLNGSPMTNIGGSDSGNLPGSTAVGIFGPQYQVGSTLGYGDEARISNIARSADWIKTEYNNQSATSTFYTIGSENPLGGGVTTTYPIARMIINLGQFIINSLFKI